LHSEELLWEKIKSEFLAAADWRHSKARFTANDHRPGQIRYGADHRPYCSRNLCSDNPPQNSMSALCRWKHHVGFSFLDMPDTPATIRADEQPLPAG
jgi:hypothetical protein